MAREVKSDTVKLKDPLANAALPKPKNPSAEVSATKPKNPPANLIPSEGYFLEIDGKIKSEYQSAEAASKAGLELKTKYPNIQVNVFDAKKQMRTLVNLSG